MLRGLRFISFDCDEHPQAKTSAVTDVHKNLCVKFEILKQAES